MTQTLNGAGTKTSQTAMSTQSNLDGFEFAELRSATFDIMEHARGCIPCTVRLLELVMFMDNPHRTDVDPDGKQPKLLYSMYNSTESAER